MIVLASSSPRRIELLKTAGLDFQVCPAQGEEYLDPALPPGEAAVAVARAKALEIAARFPEDCVIGPIRLWLPAVKYSANRKTRRRPPLCCAPCLAGRMSS